MNKKGQKNLVVFLLIGAAIAFFVIFFAMDRIEKQTPRPAEMTGDDEGVLSIRMKNEQGDTGEMLDDFYKVTGVIGSIIQGTGTVACVTDADCIAFCGSNTFCNNQIQCYQTACVYGRGTIDIPITAMALDSSGAADADGNDILITFESASTIPPSTAFGTGVGGANEFNLGVTKKATQGTPAVFLGDFFDPVNYETGATTVFSIGLSGIDDFDGTDYGTKTATVSLVISSEPTGGFSVAISQLPGI